MHVVGATTSHAAAGVNRIDCFDTVDESALSVHLRAGMRARADITPRRSQHLLFVCHCMAPATDPSSNPGGMQRAARDILDQLKTQEHVDLAVAALTCRKEQIWFRVPPYFLLLPIRILWEVGRKQNSVILFASLNPAIVLAILAPLLRRRRSCLVAICHGLDVTQGPPVWQRLVRQVLGQLDGVICVSNATAKQCLDRGFPRNRLRVLPNGISKHRSSRTPGVIQKAQRRPGDFICLGVGRQIPRKGFAWFVETVMPLLPEHIQLWLVGDGPEAAAIQNAIQSNHLDGRVLTLSNVNDDELVSLYHQADLFIMPNRPIKQDMEGFGIVLLEAGLSGLFTLASDLEGIRDVVRSENGRLLPTGDAESFRKAIIEQASLEPGQHALQSRQARQWILDHYEWEKLFPRYLATIQELSSLPRRSA